MSILKSANLLIALFVFCNGAYATLITFDEPHVEFQAIGAIPGTPWIEKDFIFQTVDDPGHFGALIRFNPDTQSSLSPNNGSTYAGITFFANPWLEQIDGKAFSLIGLDIAEYNVSYRRRGFLLTGTTITGDILSANIRLDGVIDGAGRAADFQRIDLNWANLVRLDFDSEVVAFDNIEVVTIAHPGTLWTFGLAITLLLSFHKKKIRLKRPAP